MLTPAYYRATLGPMRETNDQNDNEQWWDESDLSLVNSAEPAPIDTAAFGKRLGEIITKAVKRLA